MSVAATADDASLGTEILLAVRERIIHTLTIYPKVSPTMLQVGIGTGTPSDLWHPVLDKLIMDGIAQKKQVTAHTPKGRSQVYAVISLTDAYLATLTK